MARRHMPAAQRRAHACAPSLMQHRRCPPSSLRVSNIPRSKMVASGQVGRGGRRAGTRGVPRPVREQRILDVAGQAFSERGYHAASMEQIARRAGVTKPVVYAYFASKEGLYAAYIEREGSELIERMRAATDVADEPAERLRAGTVEFLRFVAERRDGWQLLYAEAAARGGPLAERIVELRARIVRMVRRVLEQQSLDGRATANEAAFDALAHAFVGAGESLANWWLTRPDVSAQDVTELLLASGRATVERALAAYVLCACTSRPTEIRQFVIADGIGIGYLQRAYGSCAKNHLRCRGRRARVADGRRRRGGEPARPADASLDRRHAHVVGAGPRLARLHPAGHAELEERLRPPDGTRRPAQPELHRGAPGRNLRE